MKKTKRICVALITNDEENLLFGKRNDNKLWTNVGGSAYENECPYSGMARELKEEVGLDALDMKIVKVAKIKNKLIYVFKVKIDPNQKIDTSKDPDQEMFEVSFLDPNDIVDQLHVPLEHNLVLQAWLEEEE
jgi:8-oxo-dGTP pyrophosphatase MutT (NUDIX family)